MNYRLPFVFTFILVLSFQGSNTHETSEVSYEQNFLSGVNEFAGELYKALAKKNDGNFVTSPISALILLAISAYGAEGHTREELVAAIRAPITRGIILRNYRKLIMNINDAKGIQLHLASKLYIQNDFELEWVFKHVTDVVFQSSAENIDFRDSSKAVSTINNWSKAKTADKISEIVSADDIKDIELLLVNAAYFKGQWVNSFSSDLQDQSFNLPTGNTVSIPMMCNKILYNHGELFNGSARYVEVPYETKNSSDEYSMFFIVPNEVNGVSAIGENLHRINFAELSAPKDLLQLCVPKHQIESDLNLIPALQEMGVHDLFSNNANLLNMGRFNNLKVDNIKQKAFLSVDENGTEAAVTSVVGIGTKIMKSLTIDRPFISAIVSKTTGTPVFYARINDPRV